MTFSCIGSSLFLLVLATYSYAKKSGFSDLDFESLGFIPILSISLVILTASQGISPLPFVIVSELLPNKVRSKIQF